MKRTDILIAGNNFAGYTAAIQLKHLVGPDHEVVVVGRSPQFVFTPSLIWYPFGMRNEHEIMFDVRRPFHDRDIKFFEAEIVRFEPENNKIWLHDECLPYDYLIVATGMKHDFSSVPGAGPGKFSHCVCSLECAREARRAWKEFVQSGGPAVVAAMERTQFYTSAYDFVLNASYHTSQQGLASKIPITFVTAEPHLAHLGIGGFANLREICERLFNGYRISWFAGSTIKEIVPGKVILNSGKELDSKFTVVVPAFRGSDAVSGTPEFGNTKGFIETNDEYRHHDYPNVYAIGGAVATDKDDDNDEGDYSLPKSNYPAEIMAKTAAWNVFADIYGMEKKSLPFEDLLTYSMLEAGNQGIMILGDHMLAPMGQDPSLHWSKIAFEKFYMYTKSKGNI